MAVSRPPTAEENHRLHARYELMATVELHQGAETLVLPTKNLSLGGVYVSHDGHDLSHFTVGTPIELVVFNVTDETTPSVRGGAQVVRHDKDGMALRWTENVQTQLAVANLLHALRKR